ncbi:MAG: DUF3343 domain-containing protein [Clostridia bacterium]|nr:DUF3343 domain-containing protein [Clostridia bacterium]
MNKAEKVITLRSLTHAIKAKKLLSAHGISAKVVRPDATGTEKGCGYGIVTELSQSERAEKLLREGGIVPLKFG